MTLLRTYSKTKLQRAFARSDIVRAAMRDILAAQGMRLNRHDALLTELCDQITASLTEPEIKYMLYDTLRGDPTPAERDEARRLLLLSETTLTAQQLQEL